MMERENNVQHILYSSNFVNSDMREMGLKGNEWQNRGDWKRLTKTPTLSKREKVKKMMSTEYRLVRQIVRSVFLCYQ